MEFARIRPQIWHPGNGGYVAVQLSLSAVEDEEDALFRMAHEVIHLLAPTGGRHAPVVEEGLAGLLSEQISRRYDLNKIVPDGPYRRACVACPRRRVRVEC